MKTPRTIFSLSPSFLSMLRMPRMRNSVEMTQPAVSSSTCTRASLMKHRAVMGRNTVMLQPQTQMTQLQGRGYLHHRGRAPENADHDGDEVGRAEADAVDLGKAGVTSEAATGIFVKSYSGFLPSAVELKKVISEAEAMIMTMRVLAIQNGPQRSGRSLTTCLKVGFSITADIILYFNSCSSTSKYFLSWLQAYFMLRQKKKSAGFSLAVSASPGSTSLYSFSSSLLNRLILYYIFQNPGQIISDALYYYKQPMSRDFAYLRHPPHLYSIKPKPQQALGVNLFGKPTRNLFCNVPYNAREELQIEQFKHYARQNNKSLDCEDMHILRYLYANEFDFKETLAKISIYLQWTHDPYIQTLNSKVKAILSEGFIYTYGRDIHDRPVVYVDMTKTRFDRYDVPDYYCALNYVMSIVLEHCFVKGVIEKYLFVIDMGGKNFTSLPLESLGNIISKMSVVYSNYLGQMLVINAHAFVKFTYSAVQFLIHEETRRKIQLVNSAELERITELIPRDQLFRKYMGQNPDPHEYWPPKVPGQLAVPNEDEETIYYSIQENQEIFDQTMVLGTALREQGGCCNGPCHSECSIF